MIANARARFSGGVLHPLEPLDLVEGEEVLVSIQAIPLQGSEEEPVQHGSTNAKPGGTEEERINRTMSAAGSLKGKIDGEAMKQMIYGARHRGSQETPEP